MEALRSITKSAQKAFSAEGFPSLETNDDDDGGNGGSVSGKRGVEPAGSAPPRRSLETATSEELLALLKRQTAKLKAVEEGFVTMKQKYVASVADCGELRHQCDGTAAELAAARAAAAEKTLATQSMCELAE
ncbi:unnamed protein product, partial [Phaeothamnion confervicola]